MPTIRQAMTLALSGLYTMTMTAKCGALTSHAFHPATRSFAMTVEFNMEIAVHNIIACRRRAKPQDVAAGIAWYAEAYEECRRIAENNGIAVHLSLIHI